MAQFKLEKDETGMRVTLTHATPSVAPDETTDSPDFQVRFDVGGDSVVVTLTATALQTLGLQCVALMPMIAPKTTVASVEEAYRLPARFLKAFDDHSIQVLLRECQSDTLIDFLWYMKDAELIKLLLKNCSQRAAEMLMEDIDGRWRGKNPDTALEFNARCGREAVLEITGIARRLMAEGQLPNILGEGQ
jgi:hypothetical protein